ncbi:NnrS family protein, partial [Metallibacterium scheffleri]
MNRPEAGRKPRPIAASLEHERANPRGIPPSMAHILAAAPHRMMFFAGATAVLLSMLWWTLALAAGTWSWAHWPQAPIPTIWAHAMLAQYGMLGPFIFGFTLTVFPRWSGQPELRRGAYVPVFSGV